MNFITGNNFKQYARYIFNEHQLVSNADCKSNSENITFFIKTDYVNNFFNSSYVPKEPFALITHNSDYNIDTSYSKYLNCQYLIKWYAQNVDYEHPKLNPIPIGIANEQWPHGNITTLQSVIKNRSSKRQLIYANFNTQTNYKQRTYCLQYIKPEYIKNNVSFETYLHDTSEAYFSICPLGNGIDSHRIWESLYLHTIPIAENTLNIRWLAKKYNLPIILINDWSELKSIRLDESLYYNMISSFNVNILDIKNFII